MRKQFLSTGIAALALGAALCGCTSNNQGDGGGIADAGGPANDGSTPTSVSNGGTALSGGFVCTGGAGQFPGTTTEVGSGGLVGGPLSTLLDALGATTLTQLLNSVQNPDNVIDDNLATYAGFTLTAGLFGGLLDSLDESVVLPAPATVPAGNFAVFGVGFPQELADLNALSSVKVTTFLGGTAQESRSLSQSDLNLLTKGVSSAAYAFVGVQTTKAYDTAQISLTPGVLSANVGDAMNVYELCIDGKMVTPP